MSLFDTILVEFPMLKVSTRAKVVKIVHDVLLDRIKSAQVGSTQTNIADTIANMQSSQKKNL
jgi:phage-related protein